MQFISLTFPYCLINSYNKQSVQKSFIIFKFAANSIFFIKKTVGNIASFKKGCVVLSPPDFLQENNKCLQLYIKHLHLSKQ